MNDINNLAKQEGFILLTHPKGTKDMTTANTETNVTSTNATKTKKQQAQEVLARELLQNPETREALQEAGFISKEHLAEALKAHEAQLEKLMKEFSARPPKVEAPKTDAYRTAANGRKVYKEAIVLGATYCTTVVVTVALLTLVTRLIVRAVPVPALDNAPNL